MLKQLSGTVTKFQDGFVHVECPNAPDQCFRNHWIRTSEFVHLPAIGDTVILSYLPVRAGFQWRPIPAYAAAAQRVPVDLSYDSAGRIREGTPLDVNGLPLRERDGVFDDYGGCDTKEVANG